MKDHLVLYITARDSGLCFDQQPPVSFIKERVDDGAGHVFDPTMNMSLKDSNAINIYPDIKYQTILGFGGAMTEASALNVEKLPYEKGEDVLRSYFSRESGIGYHYCRTHMNSSDFCTTTYDYVENDDAELKTFSLEHDEAVIFPAIHRANKYAENEIEVIASPWSPPAWMKDNGDRCNGGKLKPEFYQTWAEYYVKYIKGARANGVNVTTISIQNEPLAFVSWDSCLYSAEEERDFLKYYLGPTLGKAGLSDVKVLIWDHNKDLIVDRVQTIMSDKDTVKYVWGVAFHWYGGDHFYALDIVHQLYPHLKLFYTEGCHGGIYRKTGQWGSGEILAHEIFGDLNHWASACIDWNMILDEQGGPSHAQNYCDARC